MLATLFRMLLLVSLCAGAAGSLWPLIGRPEAWQVWRGSPGQRGLDDAHFESLAAFLEDAPASDEALYVVSSRADPYMWLRYLIYPRPVRWLPADLPPSRLRQTLPQGQSLIVLPFSPQPGAVPQALRVRLGGERAELLLGEPSAFALVRLGR